MRVRNIGEYLQVQNDYDEPPYSVTVLGPPESMDDSRLRLPVRYTSIIERWQPGGDYSSYVSAQMFLPDREKGNRFWHADPRISEIQNALRRG